MNQVVFHYFRQNAILQTLLCHLVQRRWSFKRHLCDFVDGEALEELIWLGVKLDKVEKVYLAMPAWSSLAIEWLLGLFVCCLHLFFVSSRAARRLIYRLMRPLVHLLPQILSECVEQVKLLKLSFHVFHSTFFV